MKLVQSILDFFKQLMPFARARTSSEIAQKALDKWNEPTLALTQLLKVDTSNVASLEAACIIWGKISSHPKREDIQFLRDLLQRLQIEAREHAVFLAADSDPVCITSLLIDLAPFQLEGLVSLARAIKQEWDQRERNDDLALNFYRIVSFYGVPLYEAIKSEIRVLFAKGNDEEAETILLEVFAKNSLPPADLYWSFISLEKRLKRSPRLQIEQLQYFVQFYSTDQCLGQAWRNIGDLYSNDTMEYQEALDAYLQAELHDTFIPQLHAYRIGNWDTIPALRAHPDALFPPIVALDLEVDPQPRAAKGSRVFEVAAVRYKGRTYLEHYHSYVQRDFFPAKWTQETALARLRNAPTVAVAGQKLRDFIGDAFVVGHNIRAFDGPELRGMGVSILQEQMIDTLVIARLLHPDSLYHHLGLLCQHYHIDVDRATLHNRMRMPALSFCTHWGIVSCNKIVIFLLVYERLSDQTVHLIVPAYNHGRSQQILPLSGD